tara:strand:+ start:322 stop:915 length:594 start_codon:yes stop_codon:yes gene_type:complete
MKTITFDWNCVIAVEKNEPAAKAILELARLHNEGKVDVAITAISASEDTRKSREFPRDGNHLEIRLANTDLADLQVLPAPGTWGLTYWGMSYWRDEEHPIEPITDALWEVMAPKSSKDILADLTDEEFHSKKYSKLRNIWCDVHTLFVHIDNKRDIFVTSNTEDFQDNAVAFERVANICAMTPDECLREIQATRPPV